MGRRRRGPQLSVVVPMRDTAAYVEECLASLLADDLAGLQVVLVDDGSTDDSLELAVDALHGRAEVVAVRSRDRGCGGARNLGVRHATGEYLAFLDSDDLVLDAGFGRLLAALEESGSDLAVGPSVRGPRMGEGRVPGWIAAGHRRARSAVRVHDVPQVTRNVLASNKVFRRAFWDAADLAFPERLRYEDQVALTRAYLRADRVDVLRDPVHLWRVRSDGSSITQTRGTVEDLQDRVVTKLLADRVVEEAGDEAVRRTWRRNGLLGDLPEYLAHLPGCDDTYWRLLRRWVVGVGVGPDRLAATVADSNLSVAHRMTAWLVAEDHRGPATALVRHLRVDPHGLPVQVDDGSLLARLPQEVRAPQPPERLRLLRSRDVGWQVVVGSVEHRGSALTVSLRSRLLRVSGAPAPEVQAGLVEVETGREVVLPVEGAPPGALVATVEPPLLPLDGGRWVLRFEGRLGHLRLPRVPSCLHVERGAGRGLVVRPARG